MTMLRTTRTVIDALGGNAAVQKMLGANEDAVWQWRSSNRFPANTYRALREALHTRGFDAPEALWPMKKLKSA